MQQDLVFSPHESHIHVATLYEWPQINYLYKEDRLAESWLNFKKVRKLITSECEDEQLKCISLLHLVILRYVTLSDLTVQLE